MNAELETISEQRCFGGVQGSYRHASLACGGPMRFSVYQPPLAEQQSVPVLYCLAGLTCNEETFAIKAGAQRLAAELGLMLVMPDTSPRETGIADAVGDWEFGEGAGFYLDAMQTPYAARFRMRSYLLSELPGLLAQHFPVETGRAGLMGHSMGGHGALTLALSEPTRFASVSAFAPIVAPTEVPWGQKAFARYLGSDQRLWAAHDACALVRAGAALDSEILIDQGLDDRFLALQLRPEALEAACAESAQTLRLRRHAGYDHSYWFIQSFIEDHLRHHAQLLGR